VANGIGSLPDVVDPDAGVLLSGYEANNSPEFINQFVLYTLDLLSNKEKWKSASKAGKVHAKSLGWKANAKRWDKKFREMIRKHPSGKNQQAQRQSLSVIMTTKDNEEHIQGCLDSVKGIADEIVVADLGSTDSTLSILKEYGCKVLDSGFDVSLMGYEQPRNQCLKEAGGKWILWLDPKDKLLNAAELEKYLRHNPYDGYSIRHQHVQKDNFLDSFIDDPPMLFRKAAARFQGMVFERPEGIGKDRIGEITDVSILNTSTSINDSHYYSHMLPLLERDRIKYPNRLVGMVHFMRDLMVISHNNFNSSYTGSPLLTENESQIVKLCNKVIELFENNFVGVDSKMAEYALAQYTDANNILGVGISVLWDLGFSKGTRIDNGNIKRARFSSAEMFQKHINPIMTKKAENITGEWTLPWVLEAKTY
jgi:hypothetical protein